MFFASSTSLPPIAVQEKVHGTYRPIGRGAFDSLTFKSGGKFEAVFMGTIIKGAYAIRHDRVEITLNNKTESWLIDDTGCVDGGARVGKYRSESFLAPAKPASPEAEPVRVAKIGKLPWSPAEAMAGAKYDGETISGHLVVMEFIDHHKVRVSFDARSGRSLIGTYEIDGPQISVSIMGWHRRLTRRGNVIEGQFEGETVTQLYRHAQDLGTSATTSSGSLAPWLEADAMIGTKYCGRTAFGHSITVEFIDRSNARISFGTSGTDVFTGTFDVTGDRITVSAHSVRFTFHRKGDTLEADLDGERPTRLAKA